MSIQNVLQNCVFFAVLCAAVLGLSAERALAAGTTMSQSILPVTFVYVGKNQAITETWSNVSKNDDLYVLKFFDASKKNELPLTDDLVASYVSRQTYREQRVRREMVQFEKENGVITQIITAT